MKPFIISYKTNGMICFNVVIISANRFAAIKEIYDMYEKSETIILSCIEL